MKITAVSLPQISTKDQISKLLEKIATYLQMSQDAFSNGLDSTRNTVSSRNIKKFLKKSPFIPVVILAVVVVFIISILFRAVTGSNNSTVLSANQSSKAESPKTKADQKINKDFTFALKDENGKDVSKLKYTVENVQLQDEIIVKGERALAVEGRTFLIINLKITNDFKQSVQINSRDYLRLSANKSTERLAPDIHNDPVEVQALSTKYTRVGFPINETDKDLMLQVGELTGPKESIKLTVK